MVPIQGQCYDVFKIFLVFTLAVFSFPVLLRFFNLTTTESFFRVNNTFYLLHKFSMVGVFIT